MTPKRLQRKRHRGYRLPPGAICVSRPSKFGNPFMVVNPAPDMWEVVDTTLGYRAPPAQFISRDDAQAYAVRRFVGYLHTSGLPLDELRGHDLACFCKLCDAHKNGKPLGVDCPDCAPCHADLLLIEAANS